MLRFSNTQSWAQWAPPPPPTTRLVLAVVRSLSRALSLSLSLFCDDFLDQLKQTQNHHLLVTFATIHIAHELHAIKK